MGGRRIAILTIGPANGTLYHVAADHLGDATQWNRIADLNGLSDPVITDIITINLPAVDPTQGGGVNQQ